MSNERSYESRPPGVVGARVPEFPESPVVTSSAATGGCCLTLLNSSRFNHRVHYKSYPEQLRVSAHYTCFFRSAWIRSSGPGDFAAVAAPEA